MRIGIFVILENDGHLAVGGRHDDFVIQLVLGIREPTGLRKEVRVANGGDDKQEAEGRENSPKHADKVTLYASSRARIIVLSASSFPRCHHGTNVREDVGVHLHGHRHLRVGQAAKRVCITYAILVSFPSQPLSGASGFLTQTSSTTHLDVVEQST